MIGLDYNDRVANEMSNIPFSYYHIHKMHPAYHAPIHWHRQTEIVRVLRGKLDMHLNGKTLSVFPGEILFINREIIHGFSPVDCEYEIINFDADMISVRINLCRDNLRIFANNNISIYPFQPQENPELYELASQLFTHACDERADNSLVVLGALLMLMGKIYALHHYKENSRSSSTVKLFKPLLELIEKQYMKPITLTEMAQACNLSVTHFSSLFHDFFKQTPIDYLNAYRIEMACLFLTNSDISVTEIAYRCGFNDSAYFVKVFKRYKNTTPKKYRTDLSAPVNKEI